MSGLWATYLILRKRYKQTAGQRSQHSFHWLRLADLLGPLPVHLSWRLCGLQFCPWGSSMLPGDDIESIAAAWSSVAMSCWSSGRAKRTAGLVLSLGAFLWWGKAAKTKDIIKMHPINSIRQQRYMPWTAFLMYFHFSVKSTACFIRYTFKTPVEWQNVIFGQGH